jgi:FMN phosphatase YigB (HAD superfamily)
MPRIKTTTILGSVEHDHRPPTVVRNAMPVATTYRLGEVNGKGMKAPHGAVFLLDVDNTLLDNDCVHDDLANRLEFEFGVEGRDRYWEIFEALRSELGYADYLCALQRFRVHDDGDPRLLRMSSFLLDYPFADRLYPGSLAAIAHLGRFGLPVILSDGDVVFQPRKIQSSGLWQAVEGRVLIYIHKEKALVDIEKHYPARHYVMIDDKLRVLTAMKQIRGNRVTTVLPRQGHYALDPKNIADYPAADVTVERIGDLVDYDLPTLRAAAQGALAHKEAP